MEIAFWVTAVYGGGREEAELLGAPILLPEFGESGALQQEMLLVTPRSVQRQELCLREAYLGSPALYRGEPPPVATPPFLITDAADVRVHFCGRVELEPTDEFLYMNARCGREFAHPVRDTDWMGAVWAGRAARWNRFRRRKQWELAIFSRSVEAPSVVGTEIGWDEFRVGRVLRVKAGS